MSYNLEAMKGPRLAGPLLRAAVSLVENPATGALLSDKLLGDAGILWFREQATHEAMPGRLGVFGHGRALSDSALPDVWALAEELPRPPTGSFEVESSLDFLTAYREGRTSPTEIAQRALELTRLSNDGPLPLRAIIAQQAEASEKRYRDGAPLSPLDGVPIAVKDELDQAAYATTVGTQFQGRQPAVRDAEAVRRLRAAGALLIGKANMHEIGIGVTGVNPHHGATRNPYAPTRSTGGSSSGSAGAVAAGLCPIAVGADGGGSIRIPAALCGQFGLKATFGRVSERGAAEVCWSVAHIGPIAATLYDTALAYAIMAGPDAGDANSMLQPQLELDDIAESHLGGIRIGLYRPWFEDADSEVVKCCYQSLELLERAGAEIHEITVPQLEQTRLAHLITIVGEMAASQLPHYAAHRQDYGHDTRLNLALGQRLQAHDYVHAQRHRAAIYRNFSQLLEQVDVIITPSTGCTAPLVHDDGLDTGVSDLELTSAIMRFSPAANLTGLPALSVPVGYDSEALPVGLQLMGRAWEEHLLLRVGAVAEQTAARQRPHVHHRYL